MSVFCGGLSGHVVYIADTSAATKLFGTGNTPNFVTITCSNDTIYINNSHSTGIGVQIFVQKIGF